MPDKDLFEKAEEWLFDRDAEELFKMLPPFQQARLMDKACDEIRSREEARDDFLYEQAKERKIEEGEIK